MKPLLLVLLSLFLVQPTWAWWDTGHILVANIAWQHTSEHTREELSKILQAHPDPQVRQLRDASLWPDTIKDKQHPFHSYSRPVWHYQNRSLKQLEQPKPDNGQMISRLREQIALLEDPDLPNSERAIALCWVVHLVGDIHQPLHNSTLFSAEFPSGDQGGNLFKVTLGQRSLPLHNLWDSAGGRFLHPLPEYRLTSYQEWFQAKHPRETFLKELSVDSIQSWSDEGLALARNEAYHALSPGTKLDNETIQRCLDVTEIRLVLASYRLARLLDRIVAPLVQSREGSRRSNRELTVLWEVRLGTAQ